MFKDLVFFIKVNGFILIILAKFAALKLKTHYYAHLFIPIIHFFCRCRLQPKPSWLQPVSLASKTYWDFSTVISTSAKCTRSRRKRRLTN